jgi:hypothetical protein
LASLYPDRFAAVAVLSPALRYMAPAEMDSARQTDAYAATYLRREEPIQLLKNLHNIPVLAVHGAEDRHTPLSSSLALQSAAKREGTPFTLRVIANATQLRYPVDPYALLFEFLKGKSRERNPGHVTYEAPSESFQSAYWLRIDKFEDPLRPASIDGRMNWQTGEMQVRTANVSRFSVLPRSSEQFPDNVSLFLNGRWVFRSRPMQGAASIWAETGRPTESEAPHQPRVAISSAFSAPFLVVAGTAGGANSPGRREAERFVQSWRARFFTECPFKNDVQVTPADMASNNLVIFGTPSSNSLPAGMETRLRIPSTAALAKQLALDAATGDLSLQAVFPNPLNPGKYVVLADTAPREGCPADAIQLALKGWYGAALWSQAPNSACRVAAVGFIDHETGRFQPVRQSSQFAFLNSGEKGGSE